MNADELLRKLNGNSDYQHLLQKKEIEAKKKYEEIRIIEKPFIEYLKKEGYQEINDSDDLLTLDSIDDRLASLILEWLPRLDNKYNSQEALVRALGKMEFFYDGTILIKLFEKKESSANLKWAIANTIAVGRAKNVKEWLKDKLTSIEQPKEYEMLVYASLKYFEKEKVIELLLPIFDSHPLQVADIFTIIGNRESFLFLSEKATQYEGKFKTQLVKSVKKLKRKLGG